MRAVPLILGLCLAAGSALGQDCAEGDWTCDPSAAPPAPAPPAAPAPSAPAPPATPTPPPQAPPPQGPEAQPGLGTPEGPAAPVAAPDAPNEPAAPADSAAAAAEPSEPPAVVYETRRSTWEDEEEGPPPVIIVDPRTRPGDPHPQEIGVRSRRDDIEQSRRPRWEPLWGVSGRLQTALGSSRGRDVEMQGLGVGFRYRPVPHFALELSLDSLRGRDWHGDRRRETIVSASALVYFNPDSTFQVYMPAGLHGSGAKVERETAGGIEDRSYGYFGAHAGIGGEIRLSRAVALPIELLGFVRGRTDSAARNDPEFVDENTKLVTNTSGGGLLRAGIVVYW